MKKFLFTTVVAIGLLAASVLASEVSQSPEQPTVVSAAAPIYPAIAVQAHAEGEVIVGVKIDSLGAVSWAHAEKGHPLLQAVCVRAAFRWKFAPRDDKTEPRTAHLTFVFVRPEKQLSQYDGDAVFFPPFKVEITPRIYRVDTNY